MDTDKVATIAIILVHAQNHENEEATKKFSKDTDLMNWVLSKEMK